MDGQTVAVDYRYAHGKTELYTGLASQLVWLKVDVLVVGNPTLTQAAKNETKTIPIVGVGMGADPVRDGLVASLARPGGNVTGSAWLTGGEFVGKWVELLQEAAPGTDRMGYMRDARDPASVRYAKDVETATQAKGLKFQDFGLRDFNEVAGVFAALSKDRGGALIVGALLLFICA